MSLSKNIFLIGFMGSGKSTVGPALAKSLKKDFIDLDDYIEVNQKKSISQIFEDDGEAHFRKLEVKYLAEILQRNGQIIALGGGTPCQSQSSALIDYEQSIYLMVSINDLLRRLVKNKESRPLVSAFLTKKALENYIRVKLKERKKHYNQCRIRIRNNQSVDLILKKIQTVL